MGMMIITHMSPTDTINRETYMGNMMIYIYMMIFSVIFNIENMMIINGIGGFLSHGGTPRSSKRWMPI